MSQKMIQIGQKRVFVSSPYQVSAAWATTLIGRQDEMEMITAAWMSGPNSMPLSPLLLGEPGVGKNRVVYELARRTGKDLFIFQGHEDVTAEDLACAVRFSDDAVRKMDYLISPLVTAMLVGGICFIDEIAKIRPRALALLVSVLDERRYIDSTLLGERVVAHPGFRFVAATNTADLEGNALPEFLRSRMRPVISMGYPSREEIEQIVRFRHPRLKDQTATLMDHFWVEWERLNKDKPPTPRDAIYAFDLALSLADFEAVGGFAKCGPEEAFSLDTKIIADTVHEEKHLKRALHELCRQSKLLEK
jgi:MoxR-like ATPase